jgi:hypothetical protein
MAKSDFTDKKQDSSNNKILSSSNGYAIQAVSVGAKKFNDITDKSNMNNVGAVGRYVSAAVANKKAQESEDKHQVKCRKCQDIGYFTRVIETPIGEYSFGIPCSDCTNISKSVMHSQEFEKEHSCTLQRTKGGQTLSTYKDGTKVATSNSFDFSEYIVE